jgi:hypothetical protein
MGFVVEVVNNLAERFVKLGDDISQRIRTLESYTRYCYIDLEHRVRKLEATGKTTYPTRTLEPPAGSDSSGSGSEAPPPPQANIASPMGSSYEPAKLCRDDEQPTPDASPE